MTAYEEHWFVESLRFKKPTLKAPSRGKPCKSQMYFKFTDADLPQFKRIVDQPRGQESDGTK